jgi:hypothetical protein
MSRSAVGRSPVAPVPQWILHRSRRPPAGGSKPSHLMSAPVQPPMTEDVPSQRLLNKTFRAFSYPNFRLMWTGAFSSTTGSFVQEVAQSWLIYQLTNDPFLLGAVIFLNNGPILLFSLVGGVMADRMDRR